MGTGDWECSDTSGGGVQFLLKLNFQKQLPEFPDELFAGSFTEVVIVLCDQ